MRFIFLIVLGAIAVNSCRKDSLLTDSNAKLTFTQDTVLFDTVFTTVGTTTKNIRIKNTHNRAIEISSIVLSGGTNSDYRINVDGTSGTVFNNIVIPAGDSIYMFVEATLDPTNQNSPMVIEDSVIFEVNGNLQNVWLHAWGQDAYFHNREIIDANETWLSDKPHVIYGYVAVDSSVTLTINPGVNVYSHNNALLYVYKGSLSAIGTPGNEITFRADRLANYILEDADSVAGQWYGIRFFQANNSTIELAEVKNAVIGIQIDTLQTGQSVYLNKVKVNNSLFANILTQGANVVAENCLFGNSASYSGIVSIGGNQNFNHCTFGNFWTKTERTTPLFTLTDYFVTNGTVYYRPFDNANFTNCIFYGPNINDQEVVLDTLERSIGGQSPVFNFNHCLFRTTNNINDGPYYSNCLKNGSPSFIDPNLWDFSISGASTAKGNGISTGIFDDINGNPRSNPPSIGCFE